MIGRFRDLFWKTPDQELGGSLLVATQQCSGKCARIVIRRRCSDPNRLSGCSAPVALRRPAAAKGKRDPVPATRPLERHGKDLP